MARDLDKIYATALAAGSDEQPRATGVRYNTRSRRIDVELSNGMALSVPARHIEGLQKATAAQLKQARIRGRGTALRWDELDADVSVAGLFRGVLGSKAWMAELGRAGGKATSARKAQAARANGQKGGRPRKRQADAEE